MDVLVSVLLGSLAILALYKVLVSRSKRLPPGPRGLSALLSVLKASRDDSLYKQAKVWHQQYGDLVLCRTVLGDFCFLNSARLVRDMFASKEREMVTNDRPKTFIGWFMFGHRDIVTSDQTLFPDWAKSRRLFHHALRFYGDGVERFESTVQTQLQHLTSTIQDKAGEEVDMDSLLTQSLFSVLCVLSTHTAGQARGIVDVLLDEQLKGDTHWLTDDVVKGIILDIIGGVTQKIQKEIDDNIGQRLPHVSDRGNLPYTEAVAMETFRLGSQSALGIPHYTSTDVAIDGFTVPKRSILFLNLWTIQHDPEVFPDPDLFRPERFLDDVTGELVHITHPVRQSSLSFGVGRRSCPGENFGRTRIFLYVTTLLQQFDILPPVTHQLPSPDPEFYDPGSVLQPKQYHLIFQKRC